MWQPPHDLLPVCTQVAWVWSQTGHGGLRLGLWQGHGNYHAHMVQESCGRVDILCRAWWRCRRAPHCFWKPIQKCCLVKTKSITAFWLFSHWMLVNLPQSKPVLIGRVGRRPVWRWPYQQVINKLELWVCQIFFLKVIHKQKTFHRWWFIAFFEVCFSISFCLITENRKRLHKWRLNIFLSGFDQSCSDCWAFILEVKINNLLLLLVHSGCTQLKDFPKWLLGERLHLRVKCYRTRYHFPPSD